MNAHDIEIQAQALYDGTAELVIQCSCRDRPLATIANGILSRTTFNIIANGHLAAKSWEAEDID
jgi:hypothetical protein